VKGKKSCGNCRAIRVSSLKFAYRKTVRAVYVVLAAVGDVLDCEARSRTRSLYFPFGSVPMFPRCLAEGPFSLGADVGSSSNSSSSFAGAQTAVSDALSVCLTLSDDGSLGHVVKLCPSRVRVDHQLTYDVVDADLGLGPGLCQYDDLQLIYEAARMRWAATVAWHGSKELHEAQVSAA
jgi:hypothetical protein